MLSYAALCRRSGAKSLGQTLIVLNLAKASHSRKIAALRDFDPADVRFGSFTSFPPSRRVPFAPKSRHSASARVYEYTLFCNGPGDVKFPRVIVTPPSSRFCPWSAPRPPHYAVRRNGEPI